jgi:hexosaminidase
MSRRRATSPSVRKAGNQALTSEPSRSWGRHRGHVCQVGPRWHALALLALAASAACAGERPSAAPPGGRTAGEPGRARHAEPATDAAASLGPPAASSPPPLGLVPAPRTLRRCAGTLVIDGATEIVVDDDPASRAVGLRLGQWLGIGASLVRTIAPGAPGPARAIVLRLEPSASPRRDPSVVVPTDANEEAYSLDISPERALLRAKHPAGLFYGAQTLAQLAGSRLLRGSTSAAAPVASPFAARPLPCATIDDAPAHRVRAMHLDVARHFFSKELVERYVDVLAFYRFNVFHWHLTDDQGFRLAIRSHPELTKVGARRIEDGKEHAGSYTQEDAREVVAYAKERFVTVVPEIEMPGHTRALLASHPELSCTGKKQPVPSTWGVFDDVLCAGNEGTYALLDDILKETTEVFPSQLVHVGGDEVPKTRWNACPKCRARMARDKLSAEQLQGAFTKRVGVMLASRGRRMLAWDEALDGGLTKDGVVVAWQSAERGRLAAAADHDVIMAPIDTAYFNFWQTRSGTEPGHEGHVPWTRVLAFDPVPRGLAPAQAAHVLGGEGALWTEHVKTGEDVETLLLPRLAALSEALWRADASAVDRGLGRFEASFPARFTAQRALLDASGVRYFVEPPVGLSPRRIFLETTTLALASPSLHPDGVVRFTLDGSDPVATSPVFTAPVSLAATTTASARLFLPGGRSSAIARGVLERVALRPPIQPSREPESFREGVLYKYFEGDFRALPDFGKLAPRRTGRLASVALDATFRPERFAVLYDAWLLAPTDGVYRFVMRADDGVWLEIDGVRVVVDDGEHAPRDAEGEIALERGPHTVRVGYFQGRAGKELSMRCEGPALPLGRCVLVSP